MKKFNRGFSDGAAFTIIILGCLTFFSYLAKLSTENKTEKEYFNSNEWKCIYTKDQTRHITVNINGQDIPMEETTEGCILYKRIK